MAYSLMKGRTVNVHYRQQNGSCNIVVHCHTDVTPDEAGPPIDVLYNGQDHYDSLLEMPPCCNHGSSLPMHLDDLELAWDQPPHATTRCLIRKVSGPKLKPCPDVANFPSLQSAVAGGMPKQQKSGFCTPLNKEKKKKPNNKKKKNADCSKKDPVPDGAAEAEPMEDSPEQVFRHRRYRKKTTPPPELRDDVLTEVCQAVVAPTSQHPHRKAEDSIQETISLEKSVPKKPNCGMHWVDVGKRN